MTQEIVNARIENTHLGIEDHGILTAWITLDFGGSGVGWGFRMFGSADKPVESAFGMEFVRQMIRTVGVDEWEQLKGKFIRCRYREGQSSRWGSSSNIEAVGHVIEDKWFNVQEVADRYFEVPA